MITHAFLIPVVLAVLVIAFVAWRVARSGMGMHVLSNAYRNGSPSGHYREGIRPCSACDGEGDQVLHGSGWGPRRPEDRAWFIPVANVRTCPHCNGMGRHG